MASSSAEPSSPTKRARIEQAQSADIEGMYEDLFEFGQSKDLGRLTTRLEDAEKKNNELLNELADLKSQLETVLAEKQRLEDNITLVYNTALRELTRKDKEIADLKSFR